MKKEQIVTCVVLCVLFLELLAIPIQFLYARVNDTTAEESVAIDWQAMYPFENDITQGMSIIENYEQLCSRITTKVENQANKYSLCKETMVELYGGFCKAIGLKTIKDSEATTVVLESGSLNFLYNKNEYVSSNISDIIEFSDYLERQGVKFLYVQGPGKLFSDSDIIPGVIENWVDQDKDVICKTLSSEGIRVLDIRDYISTDYNQYMSNFYETDHHWRPEIGIYASGLIAECLNSNYEFNIDVNKFDITNYTVKTYKKRFLGSQGKKVSLGYVNAEDFNLLIPIEQQDWTVNIPARGISTTGDFPVILDKQMLRENDLYNANPYATYIYGDQPYMSIVNNNIKSNEKILVIGDSYAEVIVPFLATEVHQIDRIDLRIFDGSIKTFLKENSYDVVIYLVSSAGQQYDSMSHKSMWDLR